MKNKLQLYFDYFKEHYGAREWRWYKTLAYRIDIIQRIRAELKKIANYESLSEEEKTAELNNVFNNASFPPPENLSKRYVYEIESLEDFLNAYFFDQDNGVGNVQQGSVWDTSDNPHKTEVIDNANSSLIFKVLTSKKDEAFDLLSNNLLRVKNGKSYKAVIFRFLRVLFPEDFVSPDAPGKLEDLKKAIASKLNIKVDGDYLNQHLELSNLVDTEDFVLKQMFFWVLPDMLDNEINLKKGLIYYGAPGTGKTYRSEIRAKEIIDAHRIKIGKEIGKNYAIQTVQFHPSYSYEDFFEGIRPNNGGGLKLFNGSFKHFCKKNGEKELALFRDEDFLHNEDFKRKDFDFSRIRINDLNKEQKEILGISNLDLAPGITIQEVIEPAFFIIDEINRAELSKVFGELMLSLEYRGYKGRIKTQYSHLCEDDGSDSAFLWEEGENWFFVPQNIYLLGTMNTIDRSVDAFDFALRRRFMWEEVEPDYEVVVRELSKAGWNDWAEKLSNSLQALNEKIENDEVLDKHYKIGHAYVLELIKLRPEKFNNLNHVKGFLWGNFINPLLEEYLRGLGDDKKTSEKIKTFKTSFH
ncbi:AAA family ATPase [Gramella sp. AN32]|uniref:AAA family ATPase n=1 Tax=Christiangramia antarctica TaxID=2058158 RepID=A0ABW5X6D9_9FLAO|nr:AAA family ATPase [Gramella sp. AN32]MCM4156179.1 hypothetical protein [Gramella sp. AN32]